MYFFPWNIHNLIYLEVFQIKHSYSLKHKHINSDNCIIKLLSNDSFFFFLSENALTFLGDTVSQHWIPGNLAIEKCCLLWLRDHFLKGTFTWVAAVPPVFAPFPGLFPVLCSCLQPKFSSGSFYKRNIVSNILVNTSKLQECILEYLKLNRSGNKHLCLLITFLNVLWDP